MKNLDYLLYGIVAIVLGGYFLINEIKDINKNEWRDPYGNKIKILFGGAGGILLGIVLMVKYFR